MKALFLWMDGPTPKAKVDLSKVERIALGPEGPLNLPVPGCPAGSAWGTLTLEKNRFYLESAGKLGELQLNKRTVRPGERLEVKLNAVLTFGVEGPSVRFGFESEVWDFMATGEGGGYSPASAMDRDNKIKAESVLSKVEVQSRITQVDQRHRKRGWVIAGAGVAGCGVVLAVTILLLRWQEERALARERELALRLDGIGIAARENKESLEACRRQLEADRAAAQAAHDKFEQELKTVAAALDAQDAKRREVEKSMETCRQDELEALKARLKDLEKERAAQIVRQEELKRALEECQIELRKPDAARFAEIQQRIEGGLFFIIARIKCSRKIFKDKNGEATAVTWSLGTGFVVDAQGTLLTCKHVVEPWKWPDLAGMLARYDAKIEGVMYFAYSVGAPLPYQDLPGKQFHIYRDEEVRLIRTAPDELTPTEVHVDGRKVRVQVESKWTNDIAVLRLDPAPRVFLTLAGDADLSGLLKGHAVMISGFPLGTDLFDRQIVESSVSMGNVRKIEDFLQHTAATCSGNSGGPILNSDGKVVAMVSFTRVGELVQAVNMGIPASSLNRLLGRER